MSEPTRLDAGGRAGARPAYCGGALLQVTSDQLSYLKRDGIRIANVQRHDGSKYLDARTRCDSELEVQRIEDHREDPREPVRVRHVRLGTCRDCRMLEEYVIRMRRGAGE